MASELEGPFLAVEENGVDLFSLDVGGASYNPILGFNFSSPSLTDILHKHRILEFSPATDSFDLTETNNVTPFRTDRWAKDSGEAGLGARIWRLGFFHFPRPDIPD